MSNNSGRVANKSVINIPAITIKPDGIDKEWLAEALESDMCLQLQRSANPQLYKDKKTGEMKATYSYYVQHGSAMCNIQLMLVAKDRFDGNPKLNGLFNVVDRLPLFLEEKEIDDNVFFSYTVKVKDIDGFYMSVDMKANTSNDKKGLDKLFDLKKEDNKATEFDSIDEE